MAGAKQFDPEEALYRAMLVFWRKGYDGTSVQDLEAATGLGRGSLYNAFGGKESLFLTILVRYGERFGAPPLRHLAEEDVREGLRRTLDAQVERLTQPGIPRGCLIVNTALAEDGSDRIGDRVTGAVRGMEVAFAAAFDRARAAGQIAESDVAGLASFYASVMVSLAAMHKARCGRETLERIAGTAMRAWPG